MSEFIATPTMEEFMLSEAHARVLAGPIGSGKSVCCAHELMRWASHQAPNKDGIRKTRFLVVRNTADQLKMTTFKTITDWFPPGVFGQWKATDKTLLYTLRLPDDTIIDTEWILIPLDTPDDVRKALSLEATGLWGNEARELHQDVVDALIDRTDRFPSEKDGGCTRAGAIFDTNMPNEDTWWEDKMENPPSNWSIHKQPPAVIPLDDYLMRFGEDPPASKIITAHKGNQYAVCPGHDNEKYISKRYYANVGEGKTDDHIRVYLRGLYGRALGGKPVHEETFVPERHIATGLSAIISENYPLCIGLDFGRQPAAIILQLVPNGQVLALGEVVAENMGIEKFVKTRLHPYLAQRFPRNSYYIAPDPAGFQKTQVGELSPVGFLQSQGFHVVRTPTNDIDPRVNAVDSLLMAGVDTQPRFYIDGEHCPILVQALKGKYRWKVDKHGEMMAAKEPIKNKWSHIAEAFQYGALSIDGGHLGRSHRRGRREVRQASAAGWT